ncbi:hypothetical protein Tco_0041886, partial [Tanacetum coccineum]
MGMGTGNPRIMKPGMGRGEKSPNPCGDPRSPLGTGMGMKNDSPMGMGTGMGMRLINGDGDGVNIVADDKVKATVVDKPKGLRKKRKAARGASGSSLPSKNLREDHGTFDASTGGKS